MSTNLMRNWFFKPLNVTVDILKFYSKYLELNTFVSLGTKSSDLTIIRKFTENPFVTRIVSIPMGYYTAGLNFDGKQVWLNAFKSHYTTKFTIDSTFLENKYPFSGLDGEQINALLDRTKINTNFGVKDVLWMLDWNKRKDQTTFVVSGNHESLLEIIKSFEIVGIKNIESTHTVLSVKCDGREFDVFACEQPLPQIATDSILFLKDSLLSTVTREDLSIVALKRNTTQFYIDGDLYNAVGGVGYVGGSGEHTEMNEVIKLLEEHNLLMNEAALSNQSTSFCEIKCPEVVKTIKRGDSEEIGFTTTKKFLAGVDDREFRDRRYNCQKYIKSIDGTNTLYLVGPQRYSASFIIISVGNLDDTVIGEHSDKEEIIGQTIVNASTFLYEFHEDGLYPPGFPAHREMLQYSLDVVVEQCNS